MLEKQIFDLFTENFAFTLVGVSILVYQVYLGKTIANNVIISIITSLTSIAIAIVRIHLERLNNPNKFVNKSHVNFNQLRYYNYYIIFNLKF